jgi:hypothetical protein
MWKVKLDDDLWLADSKDGSATTTVEFDAWLLPDMPSVQEQLKKVRRLSPYPDAMVIAEFSDSSL